MSVKKERKSRTVLDMSHEEAKNFFLRHECYSNVELPPYFNFEPLLKDVQDALAGKDLESFFKGKEGASKKKDYPSYYERVNHSFVHNKDGAYAWRPLQILHPAIYVSLVNIITDKNNWEIICNRFKEFREKSIVDCFSIPREAEENKTHVAEQVSYWWVHIEQKSIELALDFDLIYHTDISNCYGSIYTHSIPWALHGKDEAKRNRSDSLVGNKIDKYVRYMRYGQTNGIPQGSVLMDFIAEMVLGYADMLLTEKLEDKKVKRGGQNLKILRFRDDYRVFANDHKVAHEVIKALSEVMFDLGMKINSEKTNLSDSVIRSSIKPDKFAWIVSKQKGGNLREDLLLCYDFSQRFPNSGSLLKALLSFYDELTDLKNRKKEVEGKGVEHGYFDPLPLIAIVVDIALRNPRTYSVCAAILSYLFLDLPNERSKKRVLKKVYKRFKKLPHTGLMEVWLQRMILAIEQNWPFSAPLCKVVKGEKEELWNSEWIMDGDLKSAISSEKIIDKKALAITKL
ncbi:MAG: RNA-directed DNA polymerase, partial [Methanobacteriota archaeon]